MSEERKGGNLARRAAMLCQDVNFRIWLDRRAKAKYKMDIEEGTHTVDDARDFIVRACEVESRRELDHNPTAANQFFKVLRYFNDYKRRYNIH